MVIDIAGPFSQQIGKERRRCETGRVIYMQYAGKYPF